MTIGMAVKSELFDDWPDRYDQWFTTPIGRLIKVYESDLLLELLTPQPGEQVLDVGCGTGIFTMDILRAASVRCVGIDLSLPMLRRARNRTDGFPFTVVAADMRRLPFAAQSFDRVYSMTALEFVNDAVAAIAELNRVTRPGGTIVVTTLNALSPWAVRRKEKAHSGHELFVNMTFRSPQEMRSLVPGAAKVRTAVHFLKDDDPKRAVLLEAEGKKKNKDTGALVALAWEKP